MSSFRETVNNISDNGRLCISREQMAAHIQTYGIDIPLELDPLEVTFIESGVAYEWLVINEQTVIEILKPKVGFQTVAYSVYPRVITPAMLDTFYPLLTEVPTDLPEDMELILTHHDAGCVEWTVLTLGYEATLSYVRDSGNLFDESKRITFNFSLFEDDEEETDDQTQGERAEPGGADPEDHVNH